MYGKGYIIQWLKNAIISGREKSVCVDGMKAALQYLQESSKLGDLLPKEPTEEMLRAMRSGTTGIPFDQCQISERHHADYANSYKALRKLLVPSKTVIKWYCSWNYHASIDTPKAIIAPFISEDDANANRKAALEQPKLFTEVGPVYSVTTEIEG